MSTHEKIDLDEILDSLHGAKGCLLAVDDVLTGRDTHPMVPGEHPDVFTTFIAMEVHRLKGQISALIDHVHHGATELQQRRGDF